MGPAVELRIHGVGGATPQGALGEDDPDAVVELARGHRTGLWARRSDPSVRAYVWGGLTSGSRLQPLWVLLLPFTLLNVAGWMHLPVDATLARRRRVATIRGVVRFLGLTLTASWGLWLAIVVGDLLAYQGGRHLEAPGTVPLAWAVGLGVALVVAGLAWRVWWPLVVAGGLVMAIAAGARLAAGDQSRAVGGVVLAQALLGGLAAIAGVSRRRFEAHVPAGTGPAPPRGPRSNEDLRSPTFFARPGEGRALLVGHVTVVVVLTVAVAARAWVRAGDGAPSLGLGSSVVALGTVQFVGVAVLAALSAGEWADRDRRWRFAGPAVAATMAMALTTACFSGLAMWTADRIDGAVTGAELALVDVFVADLGVVAAFLVLAWVPWFVLGRPRDRRADHDGPPDPWAGRRARRRRLAQAFRHVDLVCTLGSAFLVVAALVATATRLDTGGPPWSWTVDADGGLGPLRAAGSWLLPFVVPGLGALVRLGQRSLGARRNIGNLWDVLSFWPRRFHPLAVRPYAERAVPELQDHLRHIVGTEGRPVVVSAHSQGSVLAFAALAGVAGEGWLDGVALATYGSPLSRLHARFFPAYVGPAEIDFLRRRCYAWHSFYRATDHIGQAVFAPEPGDTELADPAEGPAGIPPAAGGPYRELDRRPGASLAGHNDYLREPAVKRWVHDTGRHLARSWAGPGPAGAGPVSRGGASR